MTSPQWPGAGGSSAAAPLVSRLNPLTPLAASVFLTVAAYAGPRPWSAPVVLVAALIAALASGRGKPVALLSFAVGVPTFVLLFLMNGVVAPEQLPTVQVGPLHVAPAALGPAAQLASRLAAAVAALGWLILSVSPRRLARALADRGLPSWSVYVLVASLDAVPQARRRAGEVLDAQRARGLRFGRGLARARALVPAAGPLVLSLVSEAEERALALEARGFRPHGRRTAIDPLPDRSAERAARLVVWSVLVALVLWRLAGSPAW